MLLSGRVRHPLDSKKLFVRKCVCISMCTLYAYTHLCVHVFTCINVQVHMHTCILIRIHDTFHGIVETSISLYIYVHRTHSRIRKKIQNTYRHRYKIDSDIDTDTDTDANANGSANRGAYTMYRYQNTYNSRAASVWRSSYSNRKMHPCVKVRHDSRVRCVSKMCAMSHSATLHIEKSWVHDIIIQRPTCTHAHAHSQTHTNTHTHAQTHTHTRPHTRTHTHTSYPDESLQESYIMCAHVRAHVCRLLFEFVSMCGGNIV